MLIWIGRGGGWRGEGGRGWGAVELSSQRRGSQASGLHTYKHGPEVGGLRDRAAAIVKRPRVSFFPGNIPAQPIGLFSKRNEV